MSISVTFLGASRTVTGSKYLIEAKGKRILVDAGVFQGSRDERRRNWHTPDVPLSEIDAVVLTHAHIDHSGLLPRYYTLGLRCPVYCTAPTLDLCKLLLIDSGHLQEQETSYRIRHKSSRHSAPKPLYTARDAEAALSLFKSVPFHKDIQLFDDISIHYRYQGHILGAASICMTIGDQLLTFSGDVGGYDIPILMNPEPAPLGDLLFIESTYGDREHADRNPEGKLAAIISETASRDGVVVIPSFAVGRAQLLLFYLRELKESGAIPDIPVVVDSPMSVNATSIYKKHPSSYDEESLEIVKSGRTPFDMNQLAFVTEVSASKRLNRITEPMIIISASGMLSGGRILHHLKHRITDEKNTIVFVGHQPAGGRGAWIQSGASSLKLLGHETPIRAQIETISGLSAHADRSELLRWCKSCTGTPKHVAVVHGESQVADTFKDTLKKEFGWNAFVPGYMEQFTL